MSQLAQAQLEAADRDLGWLLEKAGARVTPVNVAAVRRYRSRSRRAHGLGVAGALLAGAAGWLAPSGSAAGVGLAWLFAGYLAGAAAAAFLTGGRRAPGPVHAASLATRGPGQLVGRTMRILPWITLLPCLAAPLLLLGEHPRGVVRIHSADGDAAAAASWFSPAFLLGTAALAFAALLLWEGLLTRLARRRLPIDDPDAAAVDMVTRVLTAHSSGAATTALGLCLLSGVLQSAMGPLHSRTCSTLTDCHFVYSWQAHALTLQNVGLLLLCAALLVYLVGRLRRAPAGRVLAAWAQS